MYLKVCVYFLHVDMILILTINLLAFWSLCSELNFFYMKTKQQMKHQLYHPWKALKVLMSAGQDAMQAAWPSNKSLKWFGDYQSLLCKVFMKWNYVDLLPWYDFQSPQALSEFSLTFSATFDIDLFWRLYIEALCVNLRLQLKIKVPIIFQPIYW